MAEKSDKINTRVIQVANIAQNTTKDQMKTLFSYIGRIDELKLYPTIDSPDGAPVTKICYVKFDDSQSTGVALHLNNTVFIDKALIIVPVMDGKIPDEQTALQLAPSAMAGLMPGQPTWPSNVISQMTGVGINQVITTHDPRLTALGLPQYPALPGSTDGSKIEEIRRTVYVTNLDPSTNTEQLMNFFSQVGEVKYVRMAGDPTGAILSGYIEFTDQRSVATALTYNGVMFQGKPITVAHSNTSITKPLTKSQEAQQREIEEAMKKVKEAQSLISAAVDDPYERSHSRSRSRSRRGSRSRRVSRSRSRKRSRSRRRSSRRSRSRKRSRSRRRSRSRKRSSSRSRKRRSRSRKRSRSRHRSRSRSKGRSKEERPPQGSNHFPTRGPLRGQIIFPVRRRSRTPRAYSRRSRSRSPGKRRSRTPKRRSKTPEKKKSKSRSPRKSLSPPKLEREVSPADKDGSPNSDGPPAMIKQEYESQPKEPVDSTEPSKRSVSRSRSRTPKRYASPKRRKSRSRSPRRPSRRSRSRSRDVPRDKLKSSTESRRSFKRSRRSRSRSRKRSRSRSKGRRDRDKRRDRDRSRDREKKKKHKERSRDREEKTKENKVVRNYDEEEKLQEDYNSETDSVRPAEISVAADDSNLQAVDMDMSD